MTETQEAEVRRDHSALLQTCIDLGNEVLMLREEYRKALEQVDAVRITLASVQRERDEARNGCQFAGPGRGDCEHFVGLPGKSIPGQHDGPDDTVDVYGRPNGWCWFCWLKRERDEAKDCGSPDKKLCGNCVACLKAQLRGAKFGMAEAQAEAESYEEAVGVLKVYAEFDNCSNVDDRGTCTPESQCICCRARAAVAKAVS